MSKQTEKQAKASQAASDSNTTEPLVEIRVESMAFGGKGVGRQDGKVYFIEDGIEGDLAEVSVTEANPRYNECRITKLIEPSPHRGKSMCPVSHVCGGCQWQGVPYLKQIEWKKNFVVNALRRIGKVGEAIEVELQPSPRDNSYRNRIFVRARISTTGELRIGYFKRGSRDFIPISSCVIAVTRINNFIEQLKMVSFREECSRQNILKEIKFRFEIQDIPAKINSEGHILLTVYETDDQSFPAKLIVDQFSKISSVFWCGTSEQLNEAPPVTFETHAGILFHTSAGIFQQINIDHNHTARSMVTETVQKLSPTTILDIYCGSGNLSLQLADGSRRIEGIEFSKRSIEIANYNVEINNLTNIKYYAGDTEKFLWGAAKQGLQYDLIIADPPREGMYKALIPLMKLKAKHILYISCDPTTLSRDLSSLCKSDYRVTRFVSLDFFPNTYHIESFVVLERLR